MKKINIFETFRKIRIRIKSKVHNCYGIEQKIFILVLDFHSLQKKRKNIRS